MSLLLAAALTLAAQPPPNVLLFPLEDRGAGSEAVEVATAAAVAALRADGLPVSGPQEVEASAGVSLLTQARGCDYDVFCLVEIGRVLAGQQVLVGHVAAVDGGWSLRLLALDVERAALVDTVTFATAPDPKALRAAASLAARRLASEPTIVLRLLVTPAEAQVAIFGDDGWVPEHGVLDGWPGRWRFDLSAPGYASRSVWIELPEGRDEVTVELDLEPDPLSVPDPKGVFATEPFGRPSRRTGSGVTVGELGVREAPEPPSRWARPLPWVVVGAGVIASAAGAALMADAYGRYDQLASETRFGTGITPADLAAAERDTLRDRHLLGSAVVISGAVTAIAGLGWLLLAPLPAPEGGAP